MVLLDLAEASWFPLLMVFVIAAVMVGLFFSMRHEIGKIRVPEPPVKPSNGDADKS